MRLKSQYIICSLKRKIYLLTFSYKIKILIALVVINHVSTYFFKIFNFWCRYTVFWFHFRDISPFITIWSYYTIRSSRRPKNFTKAVAVLSIVVGNITWAGICTYHYTIYYFNNELVALLLHELINIIKKLPTKENRLKIKMRFTFMFSESLVQVKRRWISCYFIITI